MIKYKREIVFLMLIITFHIFIVNADEVNLTLEQKASICLNESENIFNQLIAEGFSYQRVNDSLKQLIMSYNAQIILKERNVKHDFSYVITECEKIRNIRDLAYASRDELAALGKFYNESTSGLNTSHIDKIINEANREMINERYEKISPLAEKAYEEITNARASHTTLNVFYSSTARGINVFFNRNWKILLSMMIIVIVILVIYKKAISVYLIKKKISKLELRKETIKRIMMKTQREYFQDGKISEGEFTVKTTKLAELVRDIDRQIPMLKEELAKIDIKKIGDKNG